MINQKNPKKTGNYLDTLLRKENFYKDSSRNFKKIKDKIKKLYQEWQRDKSTDSFDFFSVEVNKHVKRGCLRDFNGTSFEEHVYNLITSKLQKSHIQKCFWVKEDVKNRREKTNLSLFKNLNYKADLSIYDGDNCKPMCIIECKRFLSYLDMLLFASFKSLPAFKKVHVFHVVNLYRSWDLTSGQEALKDDIKKYIQYLQTINPRYHFFKIGNQMWHGKNKNKLPIHQGEYDETLKFIKQLKNLI